MYLYLYLPTTLWSDTLQQRTSFVCTSYVPRFTAVQQGEAQLPATFAPVFAELGRAAMVLAELSTMVQDSQRMEHLRSENLSFEPDKKVRSPAPRVQEPAANALGRGGGAGWPRDHPNSMG
jgi:hypothetical protein